MITSGTFAITTTVTSTKLPTSRTGQLLFTVTNTSGRQLTVRGLVVTPQGAAQKAYFVIDGPPERPCAPNTSLDYKINISVPAEAAAGTVIVRFDAIGVENPDVYASQGPSVVVDVPPVALPKKPFPWWIVAVGAAAVLLIGGGAGFAWYAVHNHLFGQTAQASPKPTPTPPNPIDKFVGTWLYQSGPANAVRRIDIARQGQLVTATSYYGCNPTCITSPASATYTSNPEGITYVLSYYNIPYTATVTMLSPTQLQVVYVNQSGSYTYTFNKLQFCLPQTCAQKFTGVPIAKPS